jgi:hypothetical protein
MTMQLVYAETSVWNELCNQAIDPHRLASRLAKRGEKLVLGINVLFELLKTFGMSEESAASRGAELFSYLNASMHDEFPITRQTPEILVEEAMHSVDRSRGTRVLVEGVEYRFWRGEIARLAKGGFRSPREGFIEVRKATAKQSRDEMRKEFSAMPEVKFSLRKITIDRLKDWLIGEVRSERGVNSLAIHLAAVLPGESLPDLREIAKSLLGSTEYRVSHALVRNDIYLNWRLAHRGSVALSSYDDAYHVVNASYCGKFLTTDKEQVEQVEHSLSGVQVGFCEPGKPFDVWLTDSGY